MFNDESGFDAYQQVDVEAQAAAASPYQLVLMLIGGFLDTLTRAEAHMEAKRFKEKGEAIARCLDIIGGLNSALDMKRGGEMAEQMNSSRHAPYKKLTAVFLTARSVSDSESLNFLIRLQQRSFRFTTTTSA